MLSEFKQFLNIGDSKFSAFFSEFSCVAWRVLNKVFIYVVPRIIIGIIAVPCSVKLSLAASFQGTAELSDSGSMFVKSIAEQSAEVYRLNSFIEGRVFNLFWVNSPAACGVYCFCFLGLIPRPLAAG